MSIKLCSECNTNPATKPHSCPFLYEIDGIDNSNRYCTCCEDCSQSCIDNISDFSRSRRSFSTEENLNV